MFHRRRFLTHSTALAAASTLPLLARAQAWPSKPLRVVIPYAAGGVTDNVGRKLIEFVYATAKADGCSKVHWLTHETNATAIQLYERIAERPGFIQFRKGL